MTIANRNICPNCAEPIPITLDPIHPCESDPRSEYSIVHVGAEFGIALEQEIKIHGLSFESAEQVLALLKWNQNQQNQEYEWLGPL